MYSNNQVYKFQIDGGIFYTGEVVEEDAIAIKIQTIKNEVMIVNKKSIVQCKEMVGGLNDYKGKS